MRAAVREHVPKRCLRVFGLALPLRATRHRLMAGKAPSSRADFTGGNV